MGRARPNLSVQVPPEIARVLLDPEQPADLRRSWEDSLREDMRRHGLDVQNIDWDGARAALAELRG